MAWILIQAGITSDQETLAIALLHDVLEDSHLLSPRRIEINFGVNVRQGIQDLTINPGEAHEVFVQRWLGENTGWRALLVKLADRLHNLRTLDALSSERRTRKQAETRELYLPALEEVRHRMPTPALKVIAHSLGQEITTLCQM